MKSDGRFEVDGVIFDLGSTLIEYENTPWHELNLLSLRAGYDFLTQAGIAVPPIEEFIEHYTSIREKFRDYSRETLKEWLVTDAIGQFFNALDLNGDGDLPGRFFDAYYQPVARQLTIFDDTIAVLETLKQRGLRIGIVSNTIFPEGYHLRELERFAIVDYLDFAVFSSSHGYRKPHPSIYGRAVDLIGLAKERLLYVGDRYIEDYVGPSEFGLRAILKYSERHEYPDPFPEGTIVARSLTEALEHITV